MEKIYWYRIYVKIRLYPLLSMTVIYAMLATILNLAPLYGMLYPVLGMLHLLNLASLALPITSFFFLMGDTKLFRVPPYYQYHSKSNNIIVMIAIGLQFRTTLKPT